MKPFVGCPFARVVLGCLCAVRALAAGDASATPPGYLPYFEPGPAFPDEVNRAYSVFDDVYMCGKHGSLGELASAGVTLLSHVPFRAKLLEAARERKIKVLPYVSLIKVVDLARCDGSKSGSGTHTYGVLWKDHPFWRELDCSKHPEWRLVNAKGDHERPFHSKSYWAGVEMSCCNSPGLPEAYIRGVKGLIAQGACGVFVDNVHPDKHCHGPKLGKHEHIDPTITHTDAYYRALVAVYRAIKAMSPSHVVILNAGGGAGRYLDGGDMDMFETSSSWS